MEGSLKSALQDLHDVPHSAVIGTQNFGKRSLPSITQYIFFLFSLFLQTERPRDGGAFPGGSFLLNTLFLFSRKFWRKTIFSP